MDKVGPLEFPLHTGAVTTIRDVLERMIQDYGVNGVGKISVLALNLNTQLLVMVGNPTDINLASMKILPIVIPGTDLLKPH